MEDFFFKYPQKEDSLFNGIDGDSHHISLNPYYSLTPLGDNWSIYISGYKDAADILVDKILKNKSITNNLAFPTIFLYRNFIELSIKLITRYGYELYDIQEDYEQIHMLEKLWQDCRSIIEKKWAKEYFETLDIVENIIKEFSTIDSSSYETRYPERKSIKPKKQNQDKKLIKTERNRIFTMEGISKINFKNMKEIMEKINNYLGDMADAISIELSKKREIESEYNFD